MICPYPNKMINLRGISYGYLRFAVVRWWFCLVSMYLVVFYILLFVSASFHSAVSVCSLHVQSYRSLLLTLHLYLTFGNWPERGSKDVFRPKYISNNLCFNLRYETTQVLQDHSDFCITLMSIQSHWKLQLFWFKKCLQDLRANDWCASRVELLMQNIAVVHILH